MMAQWSRSAFLIGLGALALALPLGCASGDMSTSSGTGGGSARAGTGGNEAAGTSGAAGGTNGAAAGTSGAVAGTSGATGGSGAVAGTRGATGGSGAGGTVGTAGTSGVGGAAGGGKAGAGGSASGGKGGGAAGSSGGGAAGTAGRGVAGSGATGGRAGTGGTSAAGGAAGTAGGQQPFKGVANSPCADRTKLNVSWYYNWEQSDTSGACSNGAGGVFVPMIWGHTGSEQSASGITSSISSFVSKGYPYVLGFNEPDNSTQSNITVATAVSLWPSFLNPAIKTVSPATQANTTGQAWFTTFMGDVNADTTGLRTDAIGLHWYGWNAGSCDAAASQLNGYLNWAEGIAGNRPIWLNEWGCLHDSAPDVQTVVNFYKGALAVFAKHPRVQRYAWYPWSTNLALTNSDGSLTALGTEYAAAPAYK